MRAERERDVQSPQLRKRHTRGVAQQVDRDQRHDIVDKRLEVGFGEHGGRPPPGDLVHARMPPVAWAICHGRCRRCSLGGRALCCSNRRIHCRLQAHQLPLRRLHPCWARCHCPESHCMCMCVWFSPLSLSSSLFWSLVAVVVIVTVVKRMQKVGGRVSMSNEMRVKQMQCREKKCSSQTVTAARVSILSSAPVRSAYRC